MGRVDYVVAGEKQELWANLLRDDYVSLTDTTAQSITSMIDIGKTAADPATGGWGAAEKGRIWYNTTEDKYKYWNGNAIMPFSADCPPQHQANAILNQANPVQNTWYTVLETVNARIYFITLKVDDTGEDIEVKLTIDGQILTDSGTCAAASLKHVYIGSYTEKIWIWDTAVLALWNTFFEGRIIKFEIRKTTNNGNGNIHGNVTWAKH